MGSSAKFPSGPNKWALSDKPEMDDFVNDNQLLDANTMWKAAYDSDGSIADAGGISAAIEATLNRMFERFYPVGSCYISADDVNPADLFGFGTWERMAKGRMLVGVDEEDTDFAVSGSIGGEKTHALTIAEMPQHTHPMNGEGYWYYSSSITNNLSKGSGARAAANTHAAAQGGNMPHNNMPPFETVYIWRRFT